MFDIGANLTSSHFSDDLDSVLDESFDAGVKKICITSSNLQDVRNAKKITERNKNLYYSVGFHPHNAKDFKIEFLKDMSIYLDDPRAICLGEMGLDFNRNFSSREEQILCFESQLSLANSINKPLFLHQRDAHKEFLSILDNYKFNQKLIVHCFTGNLSELEDYLKRDFYIGITGWVCDLKRGLDLRECIKHIPQDKLLIETDSPYLSPRKKIRRNEPKFLIDVAEEVARLRQQTKESIVKSSYENSLNFFNLHR
ncbi:MAG: TatD family hydrolase [Pseudomonadota bacterium]|nr:TatD family hydrolase [Pseudomonadota bacterium]